MSGRMKSPSTMARRLGTRPALGANSMARTAYVVLLSARAEDPKLLAVALRVPILQS